MPVADLSEIIGKRDLVAEAQQWQQLGFQKRELELKEKKAAEKDPTKNYNFKMAEFGVDSPYFGDSMRAMNDKSYNWVLANAHLLKIDPTSPDATEEVRNAHRINNNLQFSSQEITNIANRLDKDYNNLVKLMNDPETRDFYDTVENHKKLEQIRNMWQRFGDTENFDIDLSTGHLVIQKNFKGQIHKTNDNGEKLYQTEDGGEVTLGDTDEFGESLAAIGDDGNPIPVMVEGEDFDPNLTQNMSVTEWYDTLQMKDLETNDSLGDDAYIEYDKYLLLTKGGDGVNKQINELQTRNRIQNDMILGGGQYNPETNTKRLTRAGNTIYNIMKNKLGRWPTMKEMVDYAYTRAVQLYETDFTSNPPADEDGYSNEQILEMVNNSKVQPITSTDGVVTDYLYFGGLNVGTTAEKPIMSTLTFNESNVFAFKNNGVISNLKDVATSGYNEIISVGANTIAVMPMMYNENGDRIGYMTEEELSAMTNEGTLPQGAKGIRYEKVAIGYMVIKDNAQAEAFIKAGLIPEGNYKKGDKVSIIFDYDEISGSLPKDDSDRADAIDKIQDVKNGSLGDLYYGTKKTNTGGDSDNDSGSYDDL